jgi:hypothetical protein
MSELDGCDISAMAIESIARPVDQASARGPALLQGGIGVVGLTADAYATRPARPGTAKSEICFEGFERRLAFDARRRDAEFLPVEHDGEAKPIYGCCTRTANPSGGSRGAELRAQGACYPGPDNASVVPDQLGPNGRVDGKRRSGWLALTSMPMPRKASSWRPRNRGGHLSRELFNNDTGSDRSRGLQRFLYDGLNISQLWQDNRILGLDPYDWFILLGGAAFSGVIVLLS